ncbi:MAG: beta-lactamase family protein [Phycisphaerales bacterium]|nr:beta-lactamase family protein [Phycisphaerales bacterium]
MRNLKHPRGLLVVVLGAVALACGPAQAQVLDLASRLEPIRAKHDLPALTALVTTSDETVAIGAVGVRQIGDDTPVTTDDLWHLGSCTKSMTGTLAAIMVAEGKIRWDSTVGEVFGAECPDMDPGYKGVTLEELMCHRAGVPNSPPATAWADAWKQQGTVREQRAAFVRAVLAAPPSHEPGKEFEYSNQGVTIAGAMLERAAGGEDATWEQLVTEKLFKPLGMATAGFGAPGTAASVDEPRGHVGPAVPGGARRSVPPGRGADNPPAISPAGRAHMSMEDWAKYVREHLKGREGRSELLGKEAFEHLHTDPFGGSYGMGWGLAERPWGGHVITHNGSNTMWFCVVWAAPEKGFAVLVATNCAGDEAAKATDEAAGALIRAYQAGSCHRVGRARWVTRRSARRGWCRGTRAGPGPAVVRHAR